MSRETALLLLLLVTAVATVVVVVMTVRGARGRRTAMQRVAAEQGLEFRVSDRLQLPASMGGLQHCSNVLSGQVRGVTVTAADYGVLKANHMERYQVSLAELRRSVPALTLRQPRPGSYRAEDGYELTTDDPSFTDGALDAPTIDRLRALGDEVLVDARDRTLAVRIRGAAPDAVIGLIDVTAHVAQKLVTI